MRAPHVENIVKNTIKALIAVVCIAGVFAVLDEMGIIGDNKDPPAKDVGQALKRAGNKLAKVADAQRIKSTRLKRYSPYMDKVVSRDVELERLARSIIGKRCQSTQYDCMAAALTTYVTNSVAYWKDPRGKTDYIRPWKETYKNKGGDCEDKTILLASLLESVGLRTLMFFTKGHVYPGVCFNRLPSRQYLEKGAPYWRVEYKGQQQVCFPLEPTAKNSKIGHKPSDCFHAVYDPYSKKPIPLKLKGCP